MKHYIAILAATALSVSLSAVVVHQAGPSTVELDADIAVTKSEIAAADAQAAKYTTGLILMQTQFRKSLLETTLAMLEQKRTTFLRGMRLTYHDALPRVSLPADAAATAVDLAAARAEVAAADQEAARYSGGLIQAMALVRAATARATEAAVEQRAALTKLGMALPVSSASPATPPSPGRTSADKDAL